MMINVREKYNEVIEGIKLDVCRMDSKPFYTCYLIGDDPASQRYVKLKHTTSEEANVDCAVKVMTPEEFSEEMIRIDKAGVKVRAMLQLPAPEGCVRHFNQLVEWGTIIDVDHLGDDVLTDMWNGNFSRQPGTPRGIVAILQSELHSLSGKKIAVVGSRSKTTGRFLIPMLQNLNATVSLYHSRSVIKDGEFKDYDAVVSCVGRPRMISSRHLGGVPKVLVDVGVSFIDGKVVGDFDEDTRTDNWCTPYVNGVGLLTRAMLVRNVVDSYMD